MFSIKGFLWALKRTIVVMIWAGIIGLLATYVPYPASPITIFIWVVFSAFYVGHYFISNS
jgi:uncharacterized protein involved in cysteine biosynthesis